eukprot:49771_1
MSTGNSEPLLKFVSRCILTYVEPTMNTVTATIGVIAGSSVILDTFVPHYCDEDKSIYSHPGWNFICDAYNVVLMDIGLMQYFICKAKQSGDCSKDIYNAVQLTCLLGDIMHMYYAHKYFVSRKGNEPKYKSKYLMHILLTVPLSVSRVYQIYNN